MANATKIDIFSGFLGAGKTTLIKKLIRDCFQGEQVVLIENEFGEIGIDGAFLKEAGIQINELNSGCICCTLVGDFREALRKVIETYHPDRILIEPSGVGKLSDVTRAVQGVAEELPIELNSFVTVADAKKVRLYTKNFGEFYNDQVSHASCIILSRTAELGDEKLDEAVRLLHEVNPTATVITTPWEQLSGEKILSVMGGKRDLVAELLNEAVAANKAEEGHEHHRHGDGEGGCHEHDEENHHHRHGDGEDCCCHEHDEEHHHHRHGDGEDCCCHEHGHHHHHHAGEHDADEVFSTVGAETSHRYTEAELRAALSGLDDLEGGMILRAKGLVPSAGSAAWFEFDYVPGEYELRTGSPDVTGKVVVIGAGFNEAAVRQLFRL